MSVSITLQQVNDTYNDDNDLPVYRSTNQVVASEGIPLALFVFSVSDDGFSHVATSRDLATYPDTRAEAVANDLPFYRTVGVIREYSSIAGAQAFALTIRSRLQCLSNDYPVAQDAFVGTETYTYVTAE